MPMISFNPDQKVCTTRPFFLSDYIPNPRALTPHQQWPYVTYLTTRVTLLPLPHMDRQRGERGGGGRERGGERGGGRKRGRERELQ